MGQIAKGRQAEARAALGSMSNRAQQGYRYEKGTFGSLSAPISGSLPLFP
ncbi:MAG UNVERIFIED_CONTAM: type IV pilin-like G/H family protein [Microcystis novacekii LVE1205-3]